MSRGNFSLNVARLRPDIHLFLEHSGRVPCYCGPEKEFAKEGLLRRNRGQPGYADTRRKSRRCVILLDKRACQELTRSDDVDWSLGLSLVDSSFGEYSQPFLVNLYAKAHEGTRLPVIQVGQPLLLRQIKVWHTAFKAHVC